MPHGTLRLCRNLRRFRRRGGAGQIRPWDPGAAVRRRSGWLWPTKGSRRDNLQIVPPAGCDAQPAPQPAGPQLCNLIADSVQRCLQRNVAGCVKASVVRRFCGLPAAERVTRQRCAHGMSWYSAPILPGNYARMLLGMRSRSCRSWRRHGLFPRFRHPGCGSGSGKENTRADCCKFFGDHDQPFLLFLFLKPRRAANLLHERAGPCPVGGIA